MSSIQAMLGQAVQMHQAGRLDDAVSLYRRILMLQPDQPDATHLLGLAALQRGDANTAAELIGRAAVKSPRNPLFHYNLGNAHAAMGAFEKAASAFRRAASLQPRYAEAYANLGAALARLGKHDEAITSLRRSLSVNPNYAPAHFNLASTLAERGRDSEAIAGYEQSIARGYNVPQAHLGLARTFLRVGRRDEAIGRIDSAVQSAPRDVSILREAGALLSAAGSHSKAEVILNQAISLAPGDALCHLYLGIALYGEGRYRDAEQAFRQTLARDFANAEAHNRLGALLLECGELDQAEGHFGQAIAAKSDFAEAHCNLGVVAMLRHRMGEARKHYQQALAIDADLPEAHNNLGLTHQTLGELDIALKEYARALALKPRYAEAHSNQVFALHYDPRVNAEDILAAHRHWAAAQTADIVPLPPAPRKPEAGRELRVGFVSGDFRRHPVGNFLGALFAHYDRSALKIICYANVSQPDDVTTRLRAQASLWRDTVGMPADRLAQLVRDDLVDLLIDLSGHTRDNKLLAFAYRAAPVQLTWAGYVGTTGLDSIDYLIADGFHVPEALSHLYVERVLRLPNGYVCYEPPADAPSVSALPAANASYVTFGNFNIPSKINEKAIDAWSRILDAVPNARLVLKYHGMDDPEFQGRIRTMFAARNVDPDRVQMEGGASHRDLLARYGEIDIALDTFPYSGGLTTCEALWMGVPVVTCPGARFSSRHSLSHLSNVGLTETIARDSDEYVSIAVALAHDLSRLAAIREGLRPRMASSPLCDAPRFARDFQDLLRVAWREKANAD